MIIPGWRRPAVLLCALVLMADRLRRLRPGRRRGTDNGRSHCDECRGSNAKPSAVEVGVGSG